MSDDTDMVVKARKIVTANWIDISLVRVRVTRGVVCLQGHVQSTTGGPKEKEGSEAGLKKLDNELRALKGFRGANYQFDNWRREPTGGWKCLSRRHDTKSKKRH